MTTARERLRLVSGGRESSRVASLLKEGIEGGGFEAGLFLPGERELARRHGVARKTVRRALKALSNQGLLATMPGQGYRVLPRSESGCPLAFVSSPLSSILPHSPSHDRMLVGIRKAAADRGWPLLATDAAGEDVKKITKHIESQRAFGAILDFEHPDLLAAVNRLGLPAVVVDNWVPNTDVDMVMQDGHGGAFLAAKYLCERGHRRIAWIGPVHPGFHSHERLGGAMAGLHVFGDVLPEDLLVKTTDERVRDDAFELLSRKDRPQAVIALWREYALTVRDVAEELGLTVGKDLELVGWCPEELLETEWLAHFEKGKAAAAITWSIDRMTEIAVGRIADRQTNPSLESLFTKVPVELRTFEGGHS